MVEGTRSIRQNMVIVGDYAVLKVHFLLQVTGQYDWYKDNSRYFPILFDDYVMDVEIYDKSVELAIRDTSKFQGMPVCIIKIRYIVFVYRRGRGSFMAVFLSGYQFCFDGVLRRVERNI